jgi:PPOX class probable F420-dependent enzyme
MAPMAMPLSSEIKALLDGPNFVHLATLMPDGSPQSVPVWVGREADYILICTGESSLKAKNTQRDPRVAISLVDFHDPYKEAQLRGRVVERRPDPDLKFISTPSPSSTPASHSRFAIRKEEWCS